MPVSEFKSEGRCFIYKDSAVLHKSSGRLMSHKWLQLNDL